MSTLEKIQSLPDFNTCNLASIKILLQEDIMLIDELLSKVDQLELCLIEVGRPDIIFEPGYTGPDSSQKLTLTFVDVVERQNFHTVNKLSKFRMDLILKTYDLYGNEDSTTLYYNSKLKRIKLMPVRTYLENAGKGLLNAETFTCYFDFSGKKEG